MKKAIIIIAIIISFVGGMSIGYYASSSFTGSFMEYSLYSGAAADASSILNALRELRKDNINEAIEFLESILDGELITFMNYGRLSAEKQDEKIIRILHRVKEYRSKYPRQTNYPEIDNAVKDALSVAE